MRFNRALPLLALLAGCAAADGAYPSLALRPAELGQVAPVPISVAPPPSADVLERLERLAAQATSAHPAFLDAAPTVRRAVAAAGGRDSESWAGAQVAVAGLQSARSPATAALADIDRIFIDASVGGTEVSGIAETRARVAALVGEQDRAIDSLIGALD